MRGGARMVAAGAAAAGAGQQLAASTLVPCKTPRPVSPPNPNAPAPPPHLQAQHLGRLHRGLARVLALAQLLQPPQARRDPLLVGAAPRDVAADRGVLGELPGLKVGAHHLAGPEAALGDHVLRVSQHVPEDADLGRHVDCVVGRAPEARGAQAVAVKARADLLAVGEDEQRGAVPALLQAPGVGEGRGAGARGRGGAGQGRGSSGAPLAWASQCHRRPRSRRAGHP
jgi:hypothetical protein